MIDSVAATEEGERSERRRKIRIRIFEIFLLVALAVLYFVNVKENKVSEPSTEAPMIKEFKTIPHGITIP